MVLGSNSILCLLYYICHCIEKGTKKRHRICPYLKHIKILKLSAEKYFLSGVWEKIIVPINSKDESFRSKWSDKKWDLCGKRDRKNGCCHSSVDSSAPLILPPRVLAASTQSTLFIVKFVLFLSLSWVKDKNKQKEAGFGPF